MGRVFDPLGRDVGISWQEMMRIVNDIMDNYVASHYVPTALETQNNYALRLAVSRLAELKRLPLEAKTPHELTRSLEVLNLIELGEFLTVAYQEPALADKAHWFLGTRGDAGFQ